MFRDLFLDGTFGFDIGKLMEERDGESGSFTFAWFFSCMLNLKYLVSLTNFLELKKQLLIFIESEMIPALIFGDKSLLVDLCDRLATKA